MLNTVALLAFLAAFTAGALAFAVAFQNRKSLGHWFFAAGMSVFAADAVAMAMAAESSTLQQVIVWEDWRTAIMALLPAPWLGFSVIYARGNARAFLQQWRAALIAALILPVGCAVLFLGHLLVSIPDSAGSAVLNVTDPARFIHTSVLLACILALVNLERTFRSSVGTMRWRIKFMVLGLGALFTVRAYSSSQSLLFRSFAPSLHVLDAAALLLGCLLILRTLARTGHFEVSVYPSHSVLHNSFTVLLAGAYLVIVGVLAKVVSMFGGDNAFQVKALLVLIAVVCLSILFTSDRVRLRTRQFISRHFQRPMYDYRNVWQTFTSATARHVEQPELCVAIARMLSEIFEALSVTLWLLDEKKENLVFSASTSLTEVKAGQLRVDPADALSIIHALSSQQNPVDIDGLKDSWAAALRRIHPDEFRKGGNRICVPLRAAGELLGCMVVGDRVGGVAFSAQDIDVLRTVGDQAAASLLNTQLAQKLSQAKQLEAFQAMSAFFVHDLKNTASTLSLMLQNLPVHYDDPQFRADALRGIGKTVTHINDLISRLSVLRHELKIQAVDCDLPKLVEDILKAMPPAPGCKVTTHFTPLPHVRVDPDQIQKVVTNLVINAREALASGGEVRVGTERQNGWAVLSVQDDGCGMTPEFINARLFRPFQTTKKKGIGIGMFHCKMIVEAHKGQILVHSQPGKGTEFKVLLPLDA